MSQDVVQWQIGLLRDRLDKMEAEAKENAEKIQELTQRLNEMELTRKGPRSHFTR